MGVKSKFWDMQTFNVTITSRNKSSMYHFFLFFNLTTLFSFNSVIKYSPKNVKKKKLTVLTSPHVNKSAQEQFESRLFKTQLRIQTTKAIKYLIFLKKLNSNLFPDINIKLKCIANNNGTQKFRLKFFNPNFCTFKKCYNFKMSSFHWKSPKIVKAKKNIIQKTPFIKKVNILVKFLDLYGECFKNMFE